MSEKSKSPSLSYSQIEGLSSLGIEVPKENKKEFPDYKLKIIKSNLNLEELEEMDGKAYEDYCRKILKIMFLITIKKEIFFENPQKISFSDIINFYSKNAFRYKLKINGPIKNILNDNIQEGNELDIVYSLKYKELINISEKFQKYFLLNKLDINNNKSNNNILDIEEPEITIIGEIAKNIIKQGKEKLSQIIGYMKVISIMNILKDSDLAKNDEYLKICEEYKCTPKSEKILLIITDGNYSKLKEMIQFFEKEIFNQKMSQVDIRLKISTFVEKDIFSDETNKESLQDNIYYNYLLFENLKTNHIKHALIYVGDLTSINYEEVYNKLLNIDEKKNSQSENVLNIKQNYVELKANIKKFEKKLSDITIIKYNILNPILEEFKKNIEGIINKEEVIFYDQIYRNIKINAFIYFPEEDKINNPLKEEIEKSPAMKTLKTFFNLTENTIREKEILDFLKEVENNSKQYRKQAIFLFHESKYFKENFLSNYYPFSPSIKNIVYRVNSTNTKGKIKIGFCFNDNFLSNLPIKAIIGNEVDKEMKKRKKLFEKESYLSKDNLSKKILYDLNYFFSNNKTNSNIFNDFANKIGKINLTINKNNKDELIDYYNKAFGLLEKINMKKDTNAKKEIIDNVKIKLDKLIENALSINIYTAVYKKIQEIISDIVVASIQKEILKFKVTKDTFDKQ